jgi:hypothetical protein
MGLLDDAIRDHLDLKRRRGGDPTEIERAEREALGPVRRDPFEHGPDDFEPGVFSDDRPRAYDQEGEPYDDERYEEYGAEDEWAEEFEDQPRDPRFAQNGMAEAGRGDLADSPTVLDHEYLEEPHAPMADEAEAHPSYPAEAGAGDETMQYDVEDALAAEHPEAERRPEAERSPEWVEQSDEWVEQSEEWVEPSHEPVEPPHEPMESPHEPAGGEAPHEPETARPGEPEEDVVDEAPEFLQDEPDHDQLWFEQRPPRDG